MSDSAPPLTIRLLGAIEVVRDGRPVALPASRKTRALLAYLAATGQPQRRHRLCSLLWDVPDDPRGALRSSLSKLRAVVDEPGCRRVVAEQDAIRLDAAALAIDLVAVRRLAGADAGGTATAALEAAAAAFRGEFAEGLALPHCPDFHAWCVAEREEARRLHVLLLHRLIACHESAPDVALPHVRTLVRVDPGAVLAHKTLLRVLLASGRQREAEEQRQLSQRVLGELGGGADELMLAWRALTARPAAAPSGFSSQPEAGRPTPAAEPEAPPPGRPSIIVLPFVNLSGDPEQDYLSDGITEDIITDLSRVSAIFVVARSTAFAYKGKTVEMGELAGRLNVAYALQGCVRKADGRVRVTVQLLDAATGGHLWAERFDRVLAGIFALQDDVSRSVVAALKVKLLPEELRSITTRWTTNAAAYELYRQGRAKLEESWGTRDLLRAARRLLAKAVAIDPGYAPAYAGLADCDAFLWVSGDLDVSCEVILSHSSRALELAPSLGEAHASKGVACYVAGRPREAIAAFERAIALAPELFAAHYLAGFSYRDTGDFRRAAASFERAAELQPRNYQPLTLLADVYLALGRRERSLIAASQALSRIQEAFGRDPEVAEVLAMGATALVCLGDHARAERWAKRAVMLDPESYAVLYNAACTYAVIGKPKAAQACLEAAFTNAPQARPWLLRIASHDAQLNALRDRRDFQSLIRRLELGAGAGSTAAGAATLRPAAGS